MQNNSATFVELLTMAFFLGSIAYIAGLLFQTIIVVKLNKRLLWKKLLLLLLVSRIISLTLTLLIWIYWFFNFDIMLGPFLIPAVVAEIIVSPVLLRIFGYHIFQKDNAINKLSGK
jgi:hypothetical protein